MMRLLQEHNKTFINWFRQTIFADDNASKKLRLLVVGPNLNVPTWKGYDINHYSFYTKSQDEKIVSRTVGSLLAIILITFVVLLITIRFKHPCLTMASLKIFGSLITVNLECLSSSVSGLMEIPEYVNTKWVYLQQIFKRLVTMMTHSSWYLKVDKCFMFKIHAIQDGQWFYKGEQFLSVIISMVQRLMSAICRLSLNKCLP